MSQQLIVYGAIISAIGTCFAISQLLAFINTNRPHRHVVRLACILCWLTWAFPLLNIASGLYLWWRLRQERVRNAMPYVNTRMLFPQQFDSNRN